MNKKVTYESVYASFLAASFFYGSSKDGECSCRMVLKLNDQRFLNLAWVVVWGVTQEQNFLVYGGSFLCKQIWH